MKSITEKIAELNKEKAKVRQYAPAFFEFFKGYVGKSVLIGDGSLSAVIKKKLPPLEGLHLEVSRYTIRLVGQWCHSCYIANLQGPVIESLYDFPAQSYEPTSELEYGEALAKAKKLSDELRETLRPFSELINYNVTLNEKLG